jgi:hypothetical protein
MRVGKDSECDGDGAMVQSGVSVGKDSDCDEAMAQSGVWQLNC